MSHLCIKFCSLDMVFWVEVLTICNPTIDKYTNKQHLTPLPLSLPFLFWPDLSAGWCWRCLHRCLTTFKSTSTSWRLCREPHKRCKYLWTSSYIFQWNVFCLHVIKHAHYCDSKRCHLFVSDVRKERPPLDAIRKQQQLYYYIRMARLTLTKNFK